MLRTSKTVVVPSGGGPSCRHSGAALAPSPSRQQSTIREGQTSFTSAPSAICSSLVMVS
jgi:hypothetical protein